MNSATTATTGKRGRKTGRVSLPNRAENGTDFPAAPPDAEPLEYRNEDWADYRAPAGLSTRAGVRPEKFAHVLVKELVDNALDAGGQVRFGLLSAEAGAVRLYVEDDGPGVPGSDEEIAARYSIRREMVSSKRLRRPTRGALGNGLRVVMGVVCVADGVLRVSTRGRTLTLRPRAEDGLTEIVSVTRWAGTGTWVEVEFGGSVAESADPDRGLFDCAEEGRLLGQRKGYGKGSSAHWYGADDFWALLQSAGRRPVLRQVAQLEGYSDDAKAAAVAGDLATRRCDSLTRAEARALLDRSKAGRGPVTPDRLGLVGRRADYRGYGRETGQYTLSGGTLPFVVEAWANTAGRPRLTLCLNRTPVVCRVTLSRYEGTSYHVSGAGLNHLFAAGKKGWEFRLVVNVIAPAVPLTSTGKEPDLRAIASAITAACEKAVRIAKANAPKLTGGASQKDLIRASIPGAAAVLSDGGRTIFSLRQLYYRLRPVLIEAIGEEPDYNYFSSVVGDYEDDRGEVAGLYRDNRGTLYHPHLRKEIPLGTRSVGAYERPAWTFNKVLYCEKEGFFPILKAAGFPERYDCALLTSKGFATRAAKDVIRLLGGSAEPVKFYCVHDADGPGTLIFQNLRDALRAAGIEVINLGLDPAEGRAMVLDPELVKRVRRDGTALKVPVADYVPEADRAWLQENRIELNAMTTTQFLDWLGRKLDGTRKVVPPADVIAAELADRARAEITRRLTEEAVRAAGVAERVDREVAARGAELSRAAAALASSLPTTLRSGEGRVRSWKDVAGEAAVAVAGRPAAPQHRRPGKGGGNTKQQR